MDSRLQKKLLSVARRVRTYRFMWMLAALWLVSAALGGLLIYFAPSLSSPPEHSALWLAGWVLLAVACVLVFGLRIPDVKRVARRIESTYPTLNERLLTAMHIAVNGPQARPGYLQRSVISDAIRHDIAYPWTRLISTGRMSTAWISNLIGLAVLALVFIALASMPAPESSAVPTDIHDLRHGAELKIAPGNTQLEKGTSLVITARFGEHLPDEAELVTRPLVADRQMLSEADDASRADVGEDATPMKRSLNDPVFAAYLYDLQESIHYRVDYENRSSDVFEIEVFEYPKMIRADAQLDFPDYTGQEPRTVADTRRVSAPVGTQLRWTLMLNKPVKLVQLVDGDGQSLDGSVDASDPTTVTFDIDLQETTTWTVRLVDADGRENPRETLLTARAVPNKPVDLKLLTASDQQVSPLQEFMVEADISDDFGLLRSGLTYQRTGQEPREVIVEPSEGEARNLKLSEMIDFEQLNVEPYELVSYYVWAEDLDESGQVRRSSSDIFFAEVKPFDEVFRQGSQEAQDAQQRQQQQGGGGSQETQELLEVQRQIVVGSWNVMRAASGSDLADGSQDDIELLNESQLENLQRLEEKAEELPIEGIETIVDAAGDNMQAAADGFASAGESQSKGELSEAMGSAQSAYQDLLQLQNRENEVVRSQNQQQGGGQGSSARQQQIQQLELENDEDRYEDQRLAQDSESQQQSELRQTISRLRELATRQEDLNEQLRELEAALQMAESEQEREELRERLQRLREQQEQLLQDGDEVQDRMSQQEGEEMREAQQSMQEARENLQRSTEALRNEDANSALAAGTRAEQQLQQLQDSVRQQAANQFSESVREMQASAEQLEQRQRAISEQLDTEEESTEDVGLRGSSSENDSEASQQLKQQRQQLGQLLERLQQTVEESEEAEPLLAQKLYDAFQRVKDQQVEDRLSVTEQLLEQDFREEAGELAESSQEDFEELRSGLDAAAESVLGSEVESLRLALSQLEQLSDDIDSELQSARGTPPEEGSAERETASESNDAGASSAEESQDGRGNGESVASEDAATEDADSRQATQSASSSDEEQAEGPAARADGQSQADSSASGGAQSDQPQDPAAQPPAGDAEQAAGEAGEAAGGGGRGGDAEPPTQPGQPSSDENSPSEPREPSDQPASLDQPASEQSGTPGGGGRPARGDANRTANDGGGGNLLDSFSGERRAAPITGSGYLEWSDRLRDVEELVGDPELRWQATQIRQSAREIRADLTKHSADPRWSEVEDLVATPLRDLRQQVSEELVRRAKEKTQVVPIDRDPVPGEFTGSVRQYYENLGSGR